MDSGGNANDAKNFGKAIVDCSSVENVLVQVGTIEGSLCKAPDPIKNLRDYHEFIFLDTKRILVRKVPGIGEGEIIHLKTKMDVNVCYDFEPMNDQIVKRVKPKRKALKKFIENGTVITEAPYHCEEEKQSSEEPIFESGSVFTCDKNEFCTCEFLTHQGYLEHMESDNDYCKIRVPSISNVDQVITWYIKDYGLPDRAELTRQNYNKSEAVSEMILTLQSPDPIELEKSLPKASTKMSKVDGDVAAQYIMGCGLPEPIKRTPHSKAVKQYVKECFDKGIGGKKIRAEEVVKRMWKEMDEAGNPLFPEPPTESQVFLLSIKV